LPFVLFFTGGHYISLQFLCQEVSPGQEGISTDVLLQFSRCGALARKFV
jgi:hypothetical protein